MNREEAIKYLGKPVICDTLSWGSYVGELLEIDGGSPWRGKVRILAVLRYPNKGYGGEKKGKFFDRQPFKFRSIQEFGATNIKGYKENDEVPAYIDSLKVALDRAIESLDYVRHIWYPFVVEPTTISNNYYQLLEDKKRLEKSKK